VVLHEQHRTGRGVGPLGQPDDERGEFLDVLVAEATGRLVEQQQPRLGGQRPGQRDPLAQRIRQHRRVGGGVLGDLELGQQGHRLVPEPALLAVAGRQAEQCRGEAGLHGVGGPGDHVLQHGHAGEQADPLQGPGDAELVELVRLGPHLLAVEGHGSRVRLDEAADDVEQGGLARAVRPDHADDAAGRHLQRDVLECDEAAEAHPDALQAQCQALVACFP
jgi:hypothetical protein